MATKLFGFNRGLTTLISARRLATKVDRHCDAHMNELPIPCGPWDIWYKEKQNAYNKVLAFGALWWVVSGALMIYSGAFYLNWGPPKQPGPPSDAVEECEDEC